MIDLISGGGELQIITIRIQKTSCSQLLGVRQGGGLYNNIINSNYNENKLFSVSSFFKLRVLFTLRVGCPSVRLSGNASPAAAREARNESNSTIKGIFNQCQNRVN